LRVPRGWKGEKNTSIKAQGKSKDGTEAVWNRNVCVSQAKDVVG